VASRFRMRLRRGTSRRSAPGRSRTSFPSTAASASITAT
jgi:hypothetical protein